MTTPSLGQEVELFLGTGTKGLIAFKIQETSLTTSLSLSPTSFSLSFFFLALCVFHHCHSFPSFLSLHTHLSTLICLHTGPTASPCNNLMQIRRRCPLRHTQLGKLSFSAHITYIMALTAHGHLLANPKECPHLPIPRGFLAGLSTGK